MYSVEKEIADVIETVLLFLVPNERYGFALITVGQRGERTNYVRVIGDEAG